MEKRKEFPEKLVGAFLSCYRTTDIAKMAGVSRNTVYRLKADSDFQKILNDRKAKMIETSVNEMRTCFTKNIKMLQEVIENPETPPQTKIYGISTFLSAMKSWTEITDILQRLQVLEESVQSSDSNKKSH